jgi:N6-adenosine-specific RNA methylase IME4
MAPDSSILYSSVDKCVFLIDIPTSIRLAQGAEDRVPLSRIPLKEPFAISEPTTAEGAGRLEKQQVSEADVSRCLVENALKVLSSGHEGRWCLERMFCETDEELPEDFFLNINRQGSRRESLFRIPAISTTWLPLSMIPSYTNESDTTLTIAIKLQGDCEQEFYLPPYSTFSLMTLETPPTLCKFDIVILDPPWPNRSARRKSSYNTLRHVRDVIQLLQTLQLPSLLQPKGFVAIWITNRPAVRLGVDALLEEWKLRVVEEWIWIKTTENGSPVLPLNGVWRKPYETCLIIQHNESLGIKRRVVAGVPDLHSRKPCLRELFGLLLDLPKDYDAVEIFARHMTSGWHAWGDEVLRYNWTKAWKSGD